MNKETMNKENVSKENVSKENVTKEKEKKHKKIKCQHCKKKLDLFRFTCKCGKILCQTHLSPHNHDCLYDYKKEKKESIINNNPKIEIKMIKI